MSLQVSNQVVNRDNFNNSIDFSQAALAGGIAIAWGYINPSSALGYLSSLVTGSVGTIVVQSIAETAYEAYDKWNHRAARALILSEKTPQYEQNLKAAFKRVQLHPNYEFFKAFHCNKDDKKAYAFFKNALSMGYCMGSAMAMLRTIKNKQGASCTEIVNAVNMEDVFYYQLLQFMQAAFQLEESQTRKRAWQFKGMNHLFDTSHKNEYSPSNDKYPEPEPEDKKLSQQLLYGKHFKECISNIQKDLVAWEELESEVFSAKEPTKVFQQHFEQLVKSKAFSGDPKMISGRVVISGDETDKKKGLPGHVITFQCENGKFRFYDTINLSDGGFFEYPNQTEFLAALQKQTLDDMGRKYNNILIKFCINNSPNH